MYIDNRTTLRIKIVWFRERGWTSPFLVYGHGQVRKGETLV